MMCGGNYTTIDSQKVSGSVPNQIYKWKKQEWNYDINLVTWSAGVFYGYVTIVPLALYVVLKYFFVPSGLVQLFCLCEGSSDFSQKPATKEIVKCLCQSFGKSLSSSSQTCKIDTDTVNILATRIKESFFGPEVFNSEKGLTDVLQDLKVLSEALSALMTVPIDAHVLHDEKFFSIWTQIRERLNGRESVSTFEFTENGVVKSLADYLSNGLYQRKLSNGDPECDTLPFVGKRFEVFTKLLWSDGEATSSVLIEKLQNSLSSLKNFPIVLSQFLKKGDSFAAIPNGRYTDGYTG